LYELKLEYDYLIQANQELWTITNNCDSLIVLYELSEREYNSSLKVKDEIISNTEKMYNAEKEKNNSFDNKISSLKKQNQLFKLTTGSGVVIILLFLIL
jgi:arginine utilization protein RocB